MSKIVVGQIIRGKKIREVIQLSNNWYVIKTDDSKSKKDFRVKTIYQTYPRLKSLTPKHAHFAIDFYGKLCTDREKALKIFGAIINIWHRKSVEDTLKVNQEQITNLPGYSLEYILHALNWILEQEDINFTGRPQKKQHEIDEVLTQCDVHTPSGRLGSQLAISLFCAIKNGIHPVEALMSVNLDILPRKRAFGAV